MDACVCGGGYYLLRSMQPGPFSCLDPPIPSVPPLQLANALPPVPDLRVCSQTFPYASFITRHTTDHSFSLPQRKRPGYAPCYMLRRFSHYRITPWLPLFLVERHAAAAVYVTWDVLGFACCCRFLSSRQSAFAIE